MTLADIVIASSHRLDATLPYTPDEGEAPDINEILSNDTLFICNCPLTTPHHRH